MNKTGVELAKIHRPEVATPSARHQDCGQSSEKLLGHHAPIRQRLEPLTGYSVWEFYYRECAMIVDARASIWGWSCRVLKTADKRGRGSAPVAIDTMIWLATTPHSMIIPIRKRLVPSGRFRRVWMDRFISDSWV